MNLAQLTANASLIAPEIALCIAGLVLAVAAPVLKSVSEQRRGTIFCAIALIGFAIAFVLNSGRFGGAESAFSGALFLDDFSAFFNSIFLASAAAASLFAASYIRESERLGEFLALVSLCVPGMMLMAESVEFVSLFVSFEVVSICAYALAGFSSRTVAPAEAGIKYLVTGGFSSAVMLLGIALLYGGTGSLEFGVISGAFEASPSNPMLLAGAALVFTGFIFKAGAAPLHQWIPDVYHGAPMPATAFMSVGVKVAAIAVLARFVVEIGSAGQWALPVIVSAVAAVTMLAGNISAIAQSNVKRMLAYSSVAHVGYVLVGVAAYLSGDDPAGLSGVFYYSYAYAAVSLGAFGLLSVLGRDGNEYQTFGDISGLWRTKPAAALALAVFMFALAGVPPTIGFFAKYRVFLPAAQEGLHFLVVFALVNSVVSAYYYLKVAVFAFMRPVSKQQTAGWKAGLGARAAVAFLCVVTLLLGIAPFDTAGLAESAVRALTLR